MMRVGILSENYDYNSCGLRNLLVKKYDQDCCVFIPIIKTMAGSDLENIKKMRGLLEKAISNKKLDFVIFFHDLDSLPDNEEIRRKQDWFASVKIQESDAFFLAIYEAEVLILADIQTFNRLYNTAISFTSNPLFQPEPKEFLKQRTFKAKRKYKESHLAEIFEQLNFDTIYTNHSHADHPCFQSFIDELDGKLV